MSQLILNTDHNYFVSSIFEVFDSYPSDRTVNLLKEYLPKSIKKVFYNQTKLQSSDSKQCGQFCVYYGQKSYLYIGFLWNLSQNLRNLFWQFWTGYALWYVSYNFWKLFWHFRTLEAFFGLVFFIVLIFQFWTHVTCATFHFVEMCVDFKFITVTGNLILTFMSSWISTSVVTWKKTKRK